MHQAARNHHEEERQLGERVAQRRGRAVEDLGRSVKRNLLARPHLLDRLEHAADVDRHEEQVQGVHPERIPQAVPRLQKIATVEQVVRCSAQRKPHRDEAVR